MAFHDLIPVILEGIPSDTVHVREQQLIIHPTIFPQNIDIRIVNNPNDTNRPVLVHGFDDEIDLFLMAHLSAQDIHDPAKWEAAASNLYRRLPQEINDRIINHISEELDAWWGNIHPTEIRDVLRVDMGMTRTWAAWITDNVSYGRNVAQPEKLLQAWDEAWGIYDRKALTASSFWVGHEQGFAYKKEPLSVHLSYKYLGYACLVIKGQGIDGPLPIYPSGYTPDERHGSRFLFTSFGVPPTTFTPLAISTWTQRVSAMAWSRDTLFVFTIGTRIETNNTRVATGLYPVEGTPSERLYVAHRVENPSSLVNVPACLPPINDWFVTPMSSYGQPRVEDLSVFSKEQLLTPS